MPTLLSLFNNSHKEHSSCCTCNCHEDSASMIFTPTRWFPRIKRRSSSSSSVSYDSRTSSEYVSETEERQIVEFEKLYSLAVDEVCSQPLIRNNNKLNIFYRWPMQSNLKVRFIIVVI